MGASDKLKDIYFAGEEKWYGFLDKVDEHLPVYGVIDKIDEVVPSFALLIVLIIIILLLLTITSFGLVANQEATLTLSVVNTGGEGIDRAQVTIEGLDDTFYSDKFGFVNDISVPYGYTVEITAEKNGKYKKQSFRINFSETQGEIVLPIDKLSFDSKTVQIINANGTLVTDPLELNYSCSNGVAPEAENVTNGVANASVPADCGILSLTITSSKYKTKTTTITNSSTTITLEDDITETGQATITLNFEDTKITENVEVMAFKANAAYLPEETVTASNGIAFFTLPAGDYIFKTKQSFGYKQAITTRVTINKNIPQVKTIELTKDYVGFISVNVQKGSIAAEDVLVTIRKTTELDRETTDYDGDVNFQVAETGPFIITATDEGYCEESIEASAGDTVEFRLKLDTGSCGGELKVRVVDQDSKPVQYARVILFGVTEEDSYKLSYADHRTNYDGNTSWDPVSYSDNDEKYKAFAYKDDYSGWSNEIEFNSINSSEELTIRIDLPLGLVNVSVKDNDGEPIRFSEVQLFEDFKNTKVTGKKITDELGNLSFSVKAGQRVYGVVQKEGYESYMSLPVRVNGNGSINFDVVLSKPPVEALAVNQLGLFKDGSKVLRAEAGQEYLALFEVITPKRYEELGFFVRAGTENVTKTELDKVFIKEVIAPGEKVYNTDSVDTKTLYGASYNSPKGYNIDNDYLNLEESKWGQVVWTQHGYTPGKIIVGARIKIRENAKQNEQLELGYRAWGYDSGYERAPLDGQLGTSASNSSKNALYAQTDTEFIWVGTESLCEQQGEHSFCVTSTVTDEDGITSSFDTTLEAKNNTEYDLSIKLYNNSARNFDVSKIKLENAEDNLYLGAYGLLKPNASVTSGTINNYKTEWIDTGEFNQHSEIQFTSIKATPRTTGYAPLLLRLRGTDEILFEKIFNINIASDKKMDLDFMYDGDYQPEVPQIISGLKQNLTVRAKNTINGLEINDAYVKLYDRFGTKIAEKQTNTLGIATLVIPASLPGEDLKLSVEKSEYETNTIDFRISEDVIIVTPENLTFTVNPQTNKEEIKLVKIENKTGFNLVIKGIEYTGKTKGLLADSQMESWFAQSEGVEIAQNDYEEIEFKVVSSNIVPSAQDLEGTFNIAVTNGVKTWTREIDTKIRVGLGKDVDDPNCLEATITNWNASTQGEEIEVGLDLRNNCLADGQPVKLRNLGAKLIPASNNTGTFSATTTGAYTALSRGYSRVFKTSVDGGEITPVILRFTPMGGTNGTTEGSIAFEVINKTDSTDQIITTSIDYTINIIDSSCLVLGADLVTVPEEGTASFSITNNCPESASLSIDSELQISNSTVVLASGASQEITITRNEGDNPGAYNNLVFGRIGNGKRELTGNVKAILASGSSCFNLSRYEFDVYDSPYNDADGSDTGYLRNTCTSKIITVGVSGREDFDWDLVLRDVIIGAIAGGLTNGWQILPGTGDATVGSIATQAWGSITNIGQGNNAVKNELTKLTTTKFTESLAIIQSDSTRIQENLTSHINSKTTEKNAIIAKKEEKNDEDCTKAADVLINKLNNNISHLTEGRSEIKAEFDSMSASLTEKSEVWTATLTAAHAEAQTRIAANTTDKAAIIATYDQTYSRIQSEFGDEVRTMNEKTTELKTTAESYYESTTTVYTDEEKTTYTTTCSVTDAEPEDEEELGPNVEDNSTTDPETLSPNTPSAHADLPADTVTPSEQGENNGEPGEQTEESEVQTTPTIDAIKTRIIAGLTPIANYQTYSEVTRGEAYQYNISHHIGLGSTTRYLLTHTPTTGKTVVIRNSTQDTTYNTLDLALNSITTENTPTPTAETAPIETLSTSGLFLLSTSTNGLDLGNILSNNLVNIVAGNLGGSLVGGGLTAGLLSILQGQNLDINYSSSFNVDLVTISDVVLAGEGGVGMSVGDTTFDYDDYYTSGGASTGSYTSGSSYNYNPTAMSATVGLTQIRELTFVGSGQENDSPYTPFSGILTVTGTENLYTPTYTYASIKAAATARGTYTEESGNWLEELLTPTTPAQAVMTQADLDINSTRSYEKKFHLLFNSFEYVDCGPSTYPCQAVIEPNCKVGNKTGHTGSDAVPRINLDWSWTRNSATECDESNTNYNYCDITQTTISTLKKLSHLKDFFNNNDLTQCPSSLDIAGTTTQELSSSTIDVAITQIEFEEAGSFVTIDNRVETNNNLELMSGINYIITRDDGTTVANTCDTTKKAVTSYIDYSCTLNKNDIGTGKFNVKLELDLELCEDCENNDPSNDTIVSNMILGQEGVQNCEEYSTESRNYFEKVLSANNLLGTTEGKTASEYTSFTINLMKDGFSEDFRNDFDNYLMSFAASPPEYENDLRELFLNKFEVNGPGGRKSWEAGKYKATLAIEFNQDSWRWNDVNNIKKVTLDLEAWAEPDIDHAIYDVPFNGTVGLLSDNGRNNYGAGYNQKSEKPVTIIEGTGSVATVKTETDPTSNALTTVDVEFDESFYAMNSWNSGRRGNVLTISRVGDTIDLILSPSIAVPVILNISNNNAVDAYAYYSVEVNGQPQNVGPVMITWTGIGQGCTDFSGSSMTSWDDSADSLNENGDGYGMRWNNVEFRGTASFKGVFYVPEQSSSAILVNSASESGSFETTYGNGTSVAIDSGVGIRSIKEVFDAVANNEVCVSGGDYFWNNKEVMNEIQEQINAKENSCISVG
jgi:hypothetical protein